MTKNEYSSYLLTEHWKDLSARLKEERGRCEDCGITDTLNVHHQTYDRLGRELDSDLVVLCQRCHKNRHIVDDRLRNGGELCCPESQKMNQSKWLARDIENEKTYWGVGGSDDDDY